MIDKYYVLDGKKAVQCDMLTWATWFEKADRKVAYEEHGGIRVSTVFLGLNHNFGSGKPLIFETMIFGGKYNEDMDRYSTWDEASAGHKKMCKKAFQRSKK